MNVTQSASWCDVHGESRDGGGVCWSCAGYGRTSSKDGSSDLGVGEQMLISVRQHWLVLSPAVGVTAAAAAVFVLVFQSAPSVVAGHNVRSVELFVGGVPLFIAIGLLTYGIARWRVQTFTVTTRRFILCRGLLMRVAESVILDRVQHVELRRAVFAPFGDVVIITADGAAQWAHALTDPTHFQQLLLTAVTAAKRSPQDGLK